MLNLNVHCSLPIGQMILLLWQVLYCTAQMRPIDVNMLYELNYLLYGKEGITLGTDLTNGPLLI